jgi:hypothetical protein
MKTTAGAVTTILAITALAVLALTWSQPLQAQTFVCGSQFKLGVARTNVFGSSAGAGLTINITTIDGNGAITGATIADGGHGYAVGDSGNFNFDDAGGDSNVDWQVDAVSQDDPNLLNGTVLKFHLFAPFVDLSKTAPAGPGDATTPNNKFTERTTAITKFNLCQAIDIPDKCGVVDRGEGYIPAIMARLSKDSPIQQAAINSLANVQRSDYGEMGTDGSVKGCTFTDELLASLSGFVTNATRHGDGDVAMIGLITILYAYGDKGAKVLPPDVSHHILHDLVDLTPRIGGVETLSFGVKVVPTCAAICALPGVDLGLLGCAIACPLLLGSQSVDVPETENHINMIYASQYLANQLLFEETNDSRYDNAKNGYRSALLNRLNDFTKNDFIEYNSHNYQDFTMFALLALASYANDPKVQTAAQNVLNYISAKVAVSSNDGRRSTPFRRHNDPNGKPPIHLCDELVLQECTDPQAAYYMMLAGVTGILGNLPDFAACSPGQPCLPKNNAPGNYGLAFQWTATTKYAVPDLILDLFDNPMHRKFYQFFHYSRTLRTDDFNDSNDELYYGSPSFLISAGGHPTHNAYTGDVSFPLDLVPISLSPLKLLGKHPGKNDDLGVPVATTLMPTGALHSRAQMLQFFNPGAENLCVAPNFACGFTPLIPANYAPAIGPITVPPASGTWSFIDSSNVDTANGGTLGTVPGFFVAFYRQEGFGFLEAYDTWLNPQGYKTLQDFEGAVFADNSTATFSQSSTNTYKTVGGSVIQFDVDAHIVTINGKPPYDPNRTNGDIIDNNGSGTITIKNPALMQTLTLDATRPPNSPEISIPGPLTFGDTCVGAKSYTTLNVCNVSNGSDDLFVYNVTSLDNIFQVAEPTSNYPTTIGANFCYPFQASFAPMIAGPMATKLTISNSDPVSGELRLDVSGNAIQQGIATVISNGGNFGNVCVGSYTDLNLTINNKGGCDLVIAGISSDNTVFTVAGTLSFPLTIHAGDSLDVPIRFHPSKFGPFSGNITVANNDPKMPNAVVPVSGTAPPPVINASIANNGSFGNVCAGTQSDLTVQVLNQGLCPLTISSISSNALSPAGGPSFVMPSVTTYPVTVAGGGSVDLPVRFQPPAYGAANYITCNNTVAQTANVVIHSDDPNYPDPNGFIRSVNGIEGCPTLVLSPQNLTGAYAFPATVSDPNGTLGCYTDRQIMASNSGICPLTIAALVTANGVDGKGLPLASSPPEFTVVNPTVPISIAPGASPVPLTIRFKPVILADQSANAPDQQTGTLSIVSNDPVPADNSAGLCGEPTDQSGVRVLVLNTSNTPVSSVANLTLSSSGLTPPFKQTLMPAPILSTPNICGNTVQYHLDNETLRPAGTTGNNPKGSYSLSAKNGSTQANMSFTLGQCEMKQIVVQIK